MDRLRSTHCLMAITNFKQISDKEVTQNILFQIHDFQGRISLILPLLELLGITKEMIPACRVELEAQRMLLQIKTSAERFFDELGADDRKERASEYFEFGPAESSDQEVWRVDGVLNDAYYNDYHSSELWYLFCPAGDSPLFRVKFRHENWCVELDYDPAKMNVVSAFAEYHG